MKKISIEELMKQIKRSSFVLNCGMQMGYVEGLPILQIKNERLCLLIPFLKYRVTGEVDKTLVFPIRYTVTVLLPEGKIIGYENLEYCQGFENVSFGEPVGFFRHKAIRKYNKREYAEKRSYLLSLYDKVANALIFNEEYSQKDEDEMRALLCMLVEPSMMPFYKALDRDFYSKYFE